MKIGDFVSGFLLVAFFIGATGWLVHQYLQQPEVYGGLLTYATISGLAGLFFLVKLCQTVWQEWIEPIYYGWKYK